MASFGDWIGDLGNKVNRAVFGVGSSHDNRYNNNTQAGDYYLNQIQNQYHQSGDPVYPGQAGQAAPAQTNTGAGTGGGGYAPAYDPNTDPGQVAAARNNVMGMRGGLDGLYNSIYGDVNALAQDNRSRLDTQKATDMKNFQNQYLRAQNQIGAQYGSRGAYDSSYRANTQQEGTDSYNTGLTNYNQDLENKYADIGKAYAQQMAQYQNQQGNANRLFDAANQVSTVADVNNISNQLQQLLGNLGAERAGLKTNSQYANQLKSIAPDSTGIAKDLSSKLQNLVTASAPIEAKAAIAQGYINSANLQDQNAKDYWQNYFNQLLQSGNAPAKVDPTQQIPKVVGA